MKQQKTVRDSSRKAMEGCISEPMEPHLYAELLRMKETKTVKWVGLNSSEIEKWRKKMEKFTVQNIGELKWKGATVPTTEQVECVLQTEHYRLGDKHCLDVRVLRKALSDKGFDLPPFLGGLNEHVYWKFLLYE